MTKTQEQFEIAERARRLVEARKAANFAGPKEVADRLNLNWNTYKAHESGRNGFGLAAAKVYAKAFGVNLNWLQFGTGKPTDEEAPDKHDWHDRINEAAKEAIVSGTEPTEIVNALLDLIATIRSIAEKNPEHLPTAIEVLERAAAQSRTRNTSRTEDNGASG